MAPDGLCSFVPRRRGLFGLPILVCNRCGNVQYHGFRIWQRAEWQLQAGWVRVRPDTSHPAGSDPVDALFQAHPETVSIEEAAAAYDRLDDISIAADSDEANPGE